jgi:putative DNA primase/helicase
MQWTKIPADLKERKQWVLWSMENRSDGQRTKLPYQIGGKLASSTDPKTWTDFDAVCRNQNGYSGIGYVFSADDPFCGIDFDACRQPDTGEVAAWARDWIKKLDSYSEVSPSKTGIKVWVKAKWPMESGNAYSGEVGH